MNIRFRPFPGFTLLCLPLFVALIALGVWQLERLQWKLALIAQMERNLALPPIDLDRALALPDAEYRRIALIGRFENAKETYVFTTGRGGAPVYRVLTPLVLADGRVVMIDRGYVPPELRDPATRKPGEVAGPQQVVGVWRLPVKPGAFTPPPDLGRRVWYARDLAGIARAEKFALAAPAIVEADAAPNPGGWPKGGGTRVDLPNHHLQYALTWFLLATALLIVYLAYHQSRGRLSIGPPPEQS